MNLPSIAIIKDKLFKIGEKEKGVASIYLYGSCVYSFKKCKDIDVLLVLKDNENPINLLNKLDCKIRNAIRTRKLDINYVFNNELLHFLHGDRPPTYYLYIKQSGMLVYGKDALDKVKPSLLDHYCRIVALVHRARHSYFNDIDVEFWNKKFEKWAIYVLAESYFYQKKHFDSNLKITAKKFIKENDDFKDANIMFSRKKIDMGWYLFFLEKLRIYFEKRFFDSIN